MAEPQDKSTSNNLSSPQQQQEDLVKFLAKGEEILSTFTQSIRAFEASSLQIKELSTAVGSIQEKLRQGTPEEASSSASEPKRRRLSTSSTVSEDNLDQLGSPLQSQNTVQGDLGCLDELSTFLLDEDQVGENVSDQVAEVINKNLRGRPNPEKLKTLLDTHKRPGNVANLQIPRVDGFLWDQLKQSTRVQDVSKQKTISILNQALVPLIRALDHTSTSTSPDPGVLTSNIKDTVKILCGAVTKINQSRREQIKKELIPKYRQLCTDEQPITATGLFGDDLADRTKILDGAKGVQMTSKGPNKPFLSKGGAERKTDWRKRQQSDWRQSKQQHQQQQHFPQKQKSGKQWKNSGQKSNKFMTDNRDKTHYY